LSKGDDALTITSGGGVYLLPNDGKMRCTSWNCKFSMKIKRSSFGFAAGAARI